MAVFSGIAALVTAGIGLAASAATAVGAAIGSLSLGSVLLTTATLGLGVAKHFIGLSQSAKASSPLSQAASSGGVIDPGQSVSVRGGVVPARLVLGTVRTSGAYFFLEVKPPYLCIGLLLAAHEINAVKRIWVNGTEVILGKNLVNPVGGTGSAATNVSNIGFADNEPWVRSDGRRLLQVSVGLGGDDQTVDPLIQALCPWVGGAFRQRGNARIVFLAHYGNDRDEHEKVFGSSFDVSVEIEGAKPYDPRDRMQNMDDPSTWTFRASPTLLQAWYLTHAFGAKAGDELIDWVSIAEGANIDDQAIKTRAGAYEARYAAAGVVETTGTPQTILERLLTANMARLIWSMGAYKIRPALWRDPVFTIHDRIIVGDIALRRERPSDQLVNVLRTRFSEPDSDYQIVDGPVIERADLIAFDGARREKAIEFAFSPGAPRTQRLGTMHLKESRLGRLITVQLDISAIILESGDCVRFDSQLMELFNGTYIVDKTILVQNMTMIEATLIETASSMFDFDPAIEEKPYVQRGVAQ